MDHRNRCKFVTILSVIFSVVILVNHLEADAILTDHEGPQIKNASSSMDESPTRQNDIQKRMKDGTPKEEDGNSTFYYEANTFLLNKDPSGTESSGKLTTNPDIPKTAVRLPMPASMSAISGRNGRMLDLDALVGDLATSRANKMHNQSGNRQSRFLQTGQPTLEVAGGKRLQIQGFIPIVGVKDVSDESPASSSPGPEQESQIVRQQTSGMGADLPYAQSSIGHASFGPHRYLAPDISSDMAQHQTQQQVIASNPGIQNEAKFSGAASSIVESIKRPMKRLTGGESLAQSSIGQPANTNSQQNCLCVPFYMCKNGFISESSLGKSQIQHMIVQQRQMQLAQNDLARAGALVASLQKQEQLPLQNQKELQFADSYVPVDERSFEKDIVTMSSLVSFSSENQTSEPTIDSSESAALSGEQMTGTISNSSELASNTMNSDYSQEILGRMLGLKSGSRNQGQGTASSAGVCGLLRNCCNIPMHLLPSNQDLSNEQLINQFTANVNRYSNPPSYSKPPISPQMGTELMQYQQQQQQLTRYQAQQAANNKIPYGSPSQLIRSQSQLLGSQPETSLVHRSNLFQQQFVTPTNRYPQVAQYTRSGGGPPLQLFQQQSSLGLSQGKAFSVPLATGQALRLQQASRKILEGRCGLRKSSGITGRVQSLQYPESSAEFGEYPGQAAILKRLGGSDSLFVCGGTLISQYWVATAAHCIKKHGQGDLKVRLGEWDVHRDDEFYPYVEKEVRDIVVHPEFVAGNLINDIALLRLDSAVDPSLPHVSPSCLPGIDESFARQRCWVTGWGKDSFGQKGTFQSVLRKVELPVMGQGECESALRQTRLGPHYRLHSGFICAGGEGGRDACEGDGGSGLYCIQDGLIKVAGLVSWGIGCGQAGVPGVYVSMAHYRTWIENIISIDEDIYSPNQSMINTNLISERSNSNSTENSNAASLITTMAPPTTVI